MLGDHPVEGLHVLQCPPHQPRIGHAVPVIREDPYPGGGVGHRPQLGHLDAGEVHRDGADRLDIDQAGLPAQPPHLFHHTGRVRYRRRVRHRAHRRVAAQRGGPRPGFHRLGVLTARLAQVRVQVDQAGQGDQAAGVDDMRPLRGQAAAELDHDAVAQQQVGRDATENPGILDQISGHRWPPSSR